MVRETGKWLGADDIRRAAFNQLHHLAGQEPSLAGLVAQGDDRGGVAGQIFDVRRRVKAAALLQFLPQESPVQLNGLNTGVAQFGSPGGLTQILRLEVGVIQAVEHEVQKVRHHSLRALRFQKFHQMIVGVRKELYKNLTDNADTRTPLISNRKGVKIPDDLLYISPELTVACLLQRLDTALFPYFVQMVGGPLHLLVRADTVEHPHEQVAVDHGLQHTDQKRRGDLEALVLLNALHADTDDRDMPVPVLGKGSPDESDVVRGPAAAAGLGDDDGSLVQVVFAGSEGCHDLSHHDQGRVAGVVVNVLKTGIHRFSSHLREDIHVVAASPEDRSQQIKMDRGHLRHEDGVVLAHFFGKFHLLNVGRNDLRFNVPFVPDADCRDQRANPDSCRSQVVDFVNL